MSTRLVQIADEPGDIRNAGRVKLIAHGKEQIPSLTYLLTETEHGTYFSQIMSPKVDINVSARSEFDPASLSGSLKVLDGELGYTKDAIWQTAHYYQAEVLAHEEGDSVTAPMTRPGAGAIYRKAETPEICRFTGLPEDGWVVGHLSHLKDMHGQFIPIRVNEHILRHHVLIGGTTGMGKSNGMANLICASVEAGFATVIYDHKPDYIALDKANHRHINAKAIEGATFWTLGPSERADAKPIRVEASELQPDMLASTIFWKNGEETQAEAMGVILGGFSTIQREKQRGSWGWDDFLDWFRSHKDVEALRIALPSKAPINDRTYSAIRWKLDSAGRLPTWVARRPRAQARQWSEQPQDLGATTSFFQALAAGTVHVIRVDGDGSDSRSYGLFLDYALGKIARHRKAGGPKVVHMIDEAADIFLSGNTALRNLAVSSLSMHIRKGRSMKIGFVLSVQSAGDVPPEIRQNLNSVIVYKHKNPSILREILPEQASDVFSVVNNLQRGEALVHLFGVRGLIHANMNLSPFLLFEPNEGAE